MFTMTAAVGLVATDGRPAWMAAPLLRCVQMLSYCAPEFSRSAAEEQIPDGFKSSDEGNGAKCVSGHKPQTCRSSGIRLNSH